MPKVDATSHRHDDAGDARSSDIPTGPSQDDCDLETPTVSIVQDSSAYLDALHARKDGNARWVRGLSYEDEVNELYTEYVRNQLRTTPDGSAFGSHGCARGPGAGRWLRYPLFCFIIYIILELQNSQDSFHAQHRREFPINDLQLTRSGRLSGENAFAFVTRVLVPLCLPSAFLSAGAFMLAWFIGSSTHHFVALCGIGLAALSWLAVLAQALTLWAGCDLSNVSNRWECDIPFVFYWICSVIRVGCPLLGLWTVTPMLDLARNAGYRWRVIMAFPVLSFAAAVAVKIVTGNKATFVTPLNVCHFSSIGALATLTFACWSQEPFTVVFRPVKVHTD